MEDFDKLTTGLIEITQHLENRYTLYTSVSEEIDTMIQTFITENLEEREKRAEMRGEMRGEIRGEIRGENKVKNEIAQMMLSKNEPIEKIIEYTGLSKRKINDIQKTLQGSTE